MVNPTTVERAVFWDLDEKLAIKVAVLTELGSLSHVQTHEKHDRQEMIVQ